MSKATERRAARGERWFRVDRPLARKRAFEIGLHHVTTSAVFRAGILNGTQPNWEGMAILTKAERERVRADVKAFAQASPEAQEKAFEEASRVSFVEKAKAAFQRVLGA